MDPRLLATLIDRAHEVYDWSDAELGQVLGCHDAGVHSGPGRCQNDREGHHEQGAFTSGTELVAQMYPWMQWLKQYVTEHGGKILVNTKALALVKDGDRVVGVKAQTSDGTLVFAKANTAVILAGSGCKSQEWP